MKILGQPVSPMYLWTIALLSILVAVSSYTLRAFPYSLIFAVMVAGLIEIALRKYYLKSAFKFPFSGAITGLIIGSVAPINASPLLILIAAAIAIASKFFLKFKGSNILNPASIGLLLALAIFGLGDEWWASSSYSVYGVAIPITLILVVVAYEARRLPAAISFVTAFSILSLAIAGHGAVSLAAASAVLLGANYYFAFVMLVEPKTSPHGMRAQIAYGSAVSVLYMGLSMARVPYNLLLALLIGNIIYLLYRWHSSRRISRPATT